MIVFSFNIPYCDSIVVCIFLSSLFYFCALSHEFRFYVAREAAVSEDEDEFLINFKQFSFI